MYLSYDLSISQNLYTNIYRILVIIIKNWKQLKWSSMRDYPNKLWYKHTMEYLSAIQKMNNWYTQQHEWIPKALYQGKEPVSKFTFWMSPFIDIFGKAKQPWWRGGYWLSELGREEALNAKKDFFGWNYSISWLCWLLYKSTNVLKLKNVQ